MSQNKKDQIRALLKGIESGDATAVAVVNEQKYIQHNPQTKEGSEGLAALFKRLSKTNPRVNVVRVFEDGEFIFAHTEYDFAHRNIGFEIFRFENGQAVEHWDNIQRRQAPNRSGHSMVDGTTDLTDIDRTESNRSLIQSFTEDVLINGRAENGLKYFDSDYIEHNPRLSDDLAEWQAMLSGAPGPDSLQKSYQRCHRVLAEGDFVLSVCEGLSGGAASSFFDLYRLKNDKIVEHWDTTEEIAPRSEWKNNNGKF